MSWPLENSRKWKRNYKGRESYKHMHSERVIACEHAVINEFKKYNGSKIEWEHRINNKMHCHTIHNVYERKIGK